jgi:hypothetical protein
MWVMIMGRPTVMTKETLNKLEDAYLSDATHLEAALYAGISEKTLHDYRKSHPEFSQRIDTLRGMTGLKAKVNLRKSIEDGDKHDSKWWLERKDPEFKNKSEVKADIEVNPAAAFLEAIRQSNEGGDE